MDQCAIVRVAPSIEIGFRFSLDGLRIAARQRLQGHPVPGQWVALAGRLSADLARDPVRCLVHTDLH